jgi:CarD family transcriptional regulator
MPKNWNRRFKHNREKIKEKQMYTRAKKILASEFMYALDKDAEGAEEYLDGLLEDNFGGVKATA